MTAIHRANRPLTAFPALLAHEFKEACSSLEQNCKGRLDDCHWQSIRWTGTELQIRQTRTIDADKVSDSAQIDLTDDPTDHEHVDFDSDSETLARHQSPSSVHAGMDGIIVDFSILLSPVFQTPVLWFSTPRIAPIDATSLDRVYQALVPRDSKESLQRVGILGGISIAPHPTTEMPAFFIHPCQTQEVLALLQVQSPMTAINYLMLWFGIIGAAVGLNVPVAVAAAVEADMLHKSTETRETNDRRGEGQRLEMSG